MKSKRLILLGMLVSLLFSLSSCYSCQSWYRLWGKGPVEPGCEHKFFFDKDCRPMAMAEPEPEPEPAEPEPVGECGESTVARSYPAEDYGVIRLDKEVPVEVQLNATFEYTIKVTNLTDMTVTDVVVTENIPKNLTVKGSNPAATKEGNKLTWDLGMFDAEESKVITISGMATSTDCVKTCASAVYIIPACANVEVVQPKLQLTKTAPSEVLLCDPIPVKFVVTNSGSGATRNVKIEDDLPAGLRTSDGGGKLAFNAGTLAAGQSRQFTATLKASKTGKYVNKAMASSADGLKAESETTTIVRQPVLAISKTGPEKRYLGRSVTYEITVANKGDAPAKELIVEDRIPPGVRSVVASDGGRLMAGKVQWSLGALMPGGSKKLGLTFTPERAGTVVDTASATAVCAEGVTASAETSVAGIPAVLLEVIDIDDPVELGSQTTYVITATNQGSSPGTNISIVCTLEDNEEYVSSSGATRGTIKGNVVTFAPLSSLAPKDKATWRVVVKAVKAGDVRFTVIMNTDQIERPVQETEATHLYE